MGSLLPMFLEKLYAHTVLEFITIHSLLSLSSLFQSCTYISNSSIAFYTFYLRHILLWASISWQLFKSPGKWPKQDTQNGYMLLPRHANNQASFLVVQGQKHSKLFFPLVGISGHLPNGFLVLQQIPTSKLSDLSFFKGI